MHWAVFKASDSHVSIQKRWNSDTIAECLGQEVMCSLKRKKLSCFIETTHIQKWEEKQILQCRLGCFIFLTGKKENQWISHSSIVTSFHHPP